MIRFVINMVEADKNNLLAEKRNIQAFEKLAKAEIKVNNQQALTLAALEKLMNRKKGIMATSFHTFIEIYGQIMRIDFDDRDGFEKINMSELISLNLVSSNTNVKIEAKALTTEQSLAAFFIKGGISGVIAKEAEMNANMASVRNRQADVTISQAETICVALNGVEIRAHKLSDLLARLNLIFRKTIDTTTAIITDKGEFRQNYTRDDKEKLMSCINTASTIRKIMDAPIIDSTGELTQLSINVIQTGFEYLEKMDQVINYKGNSQ
ncbi:hypothetical protein HGO21_08365 [Acinetobacter sp. CUI P1]|nr:hypothetical protein [Acinetobacter sp. CUI P1]